MAKKYIQAQRANIIAARKIANRARTSEYKATTNVLDSIYGNAATALAGTTSQMTADQNRQLAALAKLKNSKAQDRVIRRGADKVADLYGIAGTAGAKPGLDAARAAAKGSAKTIGGIAGAAATVATGNEAAAATMATGLQAAQAAAASQTAQALNYRAQNDASLAAERAIALQQTRLEAKLDYDNWLKQQKALQKLDPENGASGGAAMAAIAQTGAQSFTGLRENYNSYYDAQGNSYQPSEVHWDPESHIHYVGDSVENGTPVKLPNASQAAAAYIQDNGIIDESQAAVIQSVASAMYQAGIGKGPGQFSGASEQLIRDAVTQQLTLLFPNYGKHADQIAKAIDAGITARSSATAVDAVDRVATTNGISLDEIQAAMIANGAASNTAGNETARAAGNTAVTDTAINLLPEPLRSWALSLRNAAQATGG